MRPEGRRNISFADQALGVEWRGGLAAQLIEFLFQAVPSGAETLPDTVFRLHAEPESEVITAVRGSRLVCRGQPATVGKRLMDSVLRSLTKATDRCVLAHAAAVVSQGKAVLLAGTSKFGKSMVAAWLVSRGFEYSADAVVHLTGPSQVEGFAVPLVLPRDWQSHFPDANPSGAEGFMELAGEDFTLLSPSMINAHTHSQKAPLGLLVFPRFQPGAEAELDKMSSARALVRLLESVANPRRIGAEDVDCLASMIEGIDAYGLTYGSVDQLYPLEQLIHSLKTGPNR